MPDDGVGQPIVFVGGFLSFPAIYQDAGRTLAQVAGQPVLVVEASIHDWVFAAKPLGWKRLLDKLQRRVSEALTVSSTGKVTLVGHSCGGIVARLYLSPEPFLGVIYGGFRHVDRVITLGSPHCGDGNGRLRGWVDRVLPAAHFAPRVNYISVAGSAVRGRRGGSLRERWAHFFYRQMCGNGNGWGDGLVPVEATLLRGSRHMTLDGVSHFTGFGGPWYGQEEITPLWWNTSLVDAGQGWEDDSSLGSSCINNRRDA